jgi:hypothetical protein
MPTDTDVWSRTQLLAYRGFIGFLIRELEIELTEPLTIEQAEAANTLGKSNILGFGFGSKLRNGSWMPEAALCAFVVRKAKPSFIEDGWEVHDLVNRLRSAYLPSEPSLEAAEYFSKEIPTDVIQTSPPAAQARFDYSFPDRVPGGACVGTTFPRPDAGGPTGDKAALATLGAWVQDSSGEKYLLTCWHAVDQDNRGAQLGRKILQPASGDSIAKVSCSVDPRTGPSSKADGSTVDAALALVDDPARVGDFLLGIGEVSGAASVYARLGPFEVSKSGASSEVTHGRARHVIVDEKLKLPDGSWTMYWNQISIAAEPVLSLFSDQGDSGALVVDGNHQAIGMVVGGGPMSTNGVAFTYATPIDAVLRALEAALPSAGTLKVVTYPAPPSLAPYEDFKLRGSALP